MEGQVTKRSVSQKGNPVISVDGKPYVSAKCDVSQLKIGDRISFEAHTFGDGKVWGLDSWKLLEGVSKYPPSHPSPMTNAAPAPSGALTGGVIDAERPCISNWGAELIKAGLIKDPADLGIWVTAIKAVLRS